MNPVILASILRVVIMWVGAFLAGKGYMTAEQVEYMSQPEFIIGVIGALSALAAGGYGIWSRRPTALVKQAADLPGVKIIETDPALAAKVNSGKVYAPVVPDFVEPGMNNPGYPWPPTT